MGPSPTRRRTLQVGATAAVAGLGGCLGEKPPEGTLDFSTADSINETRLPKRSQYRTEDAEFPFYRRYDADEADTALILLHAAGLDSRYLQPVAEAIAETKAAHVFTPDLRGHGPDPEDRGDIDYEGQYVDDIRSLMRSVELTYPDAKVVVGGHGTGAGIVVRFAASQYGRLPDGYLMLSPYLGRKADTTRPGLGGWAKFYTDRIIMLRVATGFGLDGYSDMTTVEYDIPEERRDDSLTPTHTYRLMASYTPDEDTVESMADRPSLVLVGEDDETVYPDAYESAFADYPQATVEFVEEASHLDLVLTDTAVGAMTDWLGEVDSRDE
ncbi:MAG: alpha/beta hydrolase [Halohasta sp.]